MRLSLLAVAASTLLAASAHAQQEPSAPARRPAPPALLTRDDTVQAFREMSASLRSLTIAQERYWMEHGTYTTDAKALGIFTKGDRANAQVIFAGGRGWTAIATFRGLPGRSCVAFAGTADEIPRLPTTKADRRTPKPEQEGQAVCDS